MLAILVSDAEDIDRVLDGLRDEFDLSYISEKSGKISYSRPFSLFHLMVIQKLCYRVNSSCQSFIHRSQVLPTSLTSVASASSYLLRVWTASAMQCLPRRVSLSPPLPSLPSLPHLPFSPLHPLPYPPQSPSIIRLFCNVI